MTAKILIAMLIVAATSVCAPAAESVSPVPADVEKAVLAEDWAKVAKLIGEVKPDTPAPLRLVMGHACLALNRNNESLIFFLGASAPDDLESWRTYAQDLKKRYPTAPIADYFVGDCLARLGKYEEAVLSLDIALAASPRHLLSLNARAVSLALDGNTSDASSTLREAVEYGNGKFADILLSRGMLWVQVHDAPEGARECFSSSSKMSSQNSLALHGLALMALVERQFDDAVELNNRACLAAKPLAELFVFNEELYTQAAMETMVATVNPGEAAGTTLRTEFSSLSLKVDNYRQVAGRDDFMGNARANVRSIWVARDLAARPEDQIAKFAQERPDLVGPAMDAVLREQRSTEINQAATGAAGNFFLWQGVLFGAAEFVPHPVAAGGGKVGKYGSAVLSAVSKGLEHNNRQYYQDLNRIFQELGKGMDRRIREQIQFGGQKRPDGTVIPKYVPASVPIQSEMAMAQRATERTRAAIASGQYNPIGIPDPTKSSWSQPGPEMRSPTRVDAGGAKTDFSVVPWDDGNWPFKPIYGLAYGLIAARTNSPPASGSIPRTTQRADDEK